MAEPIIPRLMTAEVKHIKADVIFMAVETIQRMGEAAKADFLAKCAAENRGMVISKADLNFIKDYIASVINQAPEPPLFAEALHATAFAATMADVRRIVRSDPPCD
jgi:hypothetical protein